MTGSAVHIVVKLALQAAETRVIGAYITKHLRRKIVIRVEPFELLLEVDSLQIKLAYPCAVSGSSRRATQAKFREALKRARICCCDVKLSPAFA